MAESSCVHSISGNRCSARLSITFSIDLWQAAGPAGSARRHHRRGTGGRLLRLYHSLGAIALNIPACGVISITATVLLTD
jgi:hypothetical protein